uniref:gastrula zinc finger protein XlCGF57.1-like n=1 Tax=Semicossyphus pulcher TaxID=241346 RepID=UPI0037E92D68
MSKVEMLRVVVNRHLASTAEEILGLFVRAISEYEEELYLSKQENERQRKLLDAVLKPEVRLHGTDIQQDPEPPQIKEEAEQLWSSQEGEQLQEPVHVKSEDDEEKAQISPLQQSQSAAGSSAKEMGKECNTEGCGVSVPLIHPADEDETLESSKQAEQSPNVITHKRSDSRKPFSCSACKKQFRSKADAVRHIMIHTGEKPFSCSVCGKGFTRQSNRISHMRTHTGEKPFSCSVCGKGFTRQSSRISHMRTHTGEKPFSCSVCGKGFTRQSSRISHMRTHTGEKPFSCLVCNKRFILSGSLAQHMRVHTGEKPFSCTMCNASFTLKPTLLKHMRIHTGEKPFSCSVCEKRFTQKVNLTQHIMLHTGQKPFSCPVCGRKFTRKSRVKTHKCVRESSSSK